MNFLLYGWATKLAPRFTNATFRFTVKQKYYDTTDNFNKYADTQLNLEDISHLTDCDFDDQNTDDLFSFGKKVKISLGDMDYTSWRRDLNKDKEILDLLTVMVADITPEHDSKLQELV